MNQRWIYMYSPCRSPLPPPFCMCWEECVLRTIHIKYIWHLGEICKNAGTFCVCKLCYWLFWYSLSAWKYKVCQKLRWHRYLKNSSFMKTLNSGSSHSGLSFPTEFWVFSPGGGGGTAEWHHLPMTALLSVWESGPCLTRPHTRTAPHMLLIPWYKSRIPQAVSTVLKGSLRPAWSADITWGGCASNEWRRPKSVWKAWLTEPFFELCSLNQQTTTYSS